MSRTGAGSTPLVRIARTRPLFSATYSALSPRREAMAIGSSRVATFVSFSCVLASSRAPRGAEVVAAPCRFGAVGEPGGASVAGVLPVAPGPEPAVGTVVVSGAVDTPERTDGDG